MHDERTAVPDSTAVRVALWRAMHMQVDRAPCSLHRSSIPRSARSMRRSINAREQPGRRF
jgi:hypothetical protein